MKVATCPVCNNSVFEGQVHCTSCGQLSPLNPRLLKEQQKNYLVQHPRHSPGFGIRGNF